MFAFGCISTLAIKELSFVKNAIAKTGTKCDYSYLSDGGFPDIGEDGKIKYDEDWSKMIEDGWELAFPINGDSSPKGYMFKKCPKK